MTASVLIPGNRRVISGKILLAGVRTGWKEFLVRAWLPLACLILWHLAAVLLSSPYLPTPMTVATAFWNEWLPWTENGRASLQQNFGPTLQLILSGWLCAIVIGVPAGLAVGRSAHVAELLNPIIRFGMNVPPPVLLPLIIVLLGFGLPGKLALIVVGTLWPILMNTILGAQSIDPIAIKTARTLHLRRSTVIWKIILPASLPAIFSGLRIALSLSIMLVVIAEMYTASQGVGFAIVSAQMMFDIQVMWAGIVMLAVLGIGLNLLFVAAERRVLFWHQSTRQQGSRS